MTQAALLTLHGMGDTKADYAQELFARVGAMLAAGGAPEVSFEAVYYQQELQENEKLLWHRYVDQQSLAWQPLRRFVLFNFGDAVGLEAGKDEPDSSYHMAQLNIAAALLAVHDKIGSSAPLVVLAHSLGGQVFSCYLYDAQRAQRFETTGEGSPPPVGIWHDIRGAVQRALQRDLSDEQVEYLRGTTVGSLITIGCNIPVFVAAHRRMSVRPIAPPSAHFEWHNYFNPNDVLGWPLQPLSAGYAALVKDHSIAAGNLLTSWNPLSHDAYWSDPAVLDEVMTQLRRALALRPAAAPIATVQAQPLSEP